MSLEWAQNTEIPKSVPVEKTEQFESEQNFEQELSPEQIEKIMEKVKDVNEKGTIFSGVTLKTKRNHETGKHFFCVGEDLLEESEDNALRLSCTALSSILKNGLLGNNYNYDSENDPSHYIVDRKERWLKQARRDRTAVLYANIIGRDVSNIKETPFGEIGGTFNTAGKFGLVYNLKNFTETFPCFEVDGNIKSAKTKTFRDLHGAFYSLLSRLTWTIVEELNIDPTNLDYETFIKTIKNRKEEASLILNDFSNYSKRQESKQEKPANIDEYIAYMEKAGSFHELMGHSGGDWGFVIARRVPPRNLEGIVIRLYKMDENYYKTIQSSEKEKHTMINEAVNVMKKSVKETSEDRYLPLYDFNGNLLWPKQMSYEEVKKFIAERDAEN